MTADELNSYLNTGMSADAGFAMKKQASRIKCRDGHSLSVQASQYHYCWPRNDLGPWDYVEVGFPTAEPPESWAEYFDGDWEQGGRTDSVYAYVPIALVAEFICAHGGVA